MNGFGINCFKNILIFSFVKKYKYDLFFLYSYQALWDLQADNLYGKLGDNITLWIKCLNDIKLVTY